MSDDKSRGGKAELRTVDLEDLQSCDYREEAGEEIEASVKVAVEDLDRIKRTAPAPKSKKPSKSASLVSKGQSKGQKGKSSSAELDRLTAKYQLDRKKLNWPLAAGVALILALGLLFKIFPFIDEVLGVGAVMSYFPLYALALLVLFPLRLPTTSMFEIYHEGISAPLGIFSPGRPERARLKWSDIREIEFKSKREVPYVLLLGKNGRELGELRLDVDRPEVFYRAIDRHAPREHVLRKLINS